MESATATATRATNRGVTLVGQNRIFAAIGVEIFHHELNYYWCDFRGDRWKRPTLTQLCQDLLRHIYEEAMLNG
jgi:hypothetical protein